jgi:hypothetical protein
MKANYREMSPYLSSNFRGDDDLRFSITKISAIYTTASGYPNILTITLSTEESSMHG